MTGIKYFISVISQFYPLLKFRMGSSFTAGLVGRMMRFADVGKKMHGCTQMECGAAVIAFFPFMNSNGYMQPGLGFCCIRNISVGKILTRIRIIKVILIQRIFIRIEIRPYRTAP